jgi:hypothetical protein
VGGVAGWWCRPDDAIAGAALLCLHGGAYVVGSARAYRHFCKETASLVLLPLLSGKGRASSALRPVGAVVMPPWTGLALPGQQRVRRTSTARLYVGGHDPRTATWLGCRRSEFTWAKTKFSLTTRFATASVSKA